ncbi:glycoside hydrolase family 19 protein [Myxococcus sp. 1LA]
MTPRQKMIAGIGAAVVAGGVAAVALSRTASAAPGDPDLVTLDELKELTPRLTDEKRRAYLPLLNAALREWNITTIPRIAAALGQWLHESWQFSALVEIAPNVEAYANNAGLGNAGNVADAARYIGRGVTQLTGRSNYTRAGAALGLDLVNRPELAADPVHAFRIAGWFWVKGSSADFNVLADRGDFLGITKKLNGGTNGLADREKYHAQALAIFARRQSK